MAQNLVFFYALTIFLSQLLVAGMSFFTPFSILQIYLITLFFVHIWVVYSFFLIVYVASSLCISDEDCPEALPLMFVKCVCGACEYYTQIQDEK